MNLSRYLPGIAVVVTALYFISKMVTPASPEDGFNFEKFARLPIVERGRVKPIDTLARTDLMLISDRQEFLEFNKWKEYEEASIFEVAKMRRPAVKWLLDTLAYSEIMNMMVMRDQKGAPPRSFFEHVIRIENDQVLDFLELKPRSGFFRYSVAEIQPKMEAFYEAAHNAQDLDPKDRTLFDAKLIELGNRLEIFSSLITLDVTKKPEVIPHIVPPQKAGEEWQTLRYGMAALVEDRDFLDQIEHQRGPTARRGAKPAELWYNLLLAYRQNKPTEFNTILDRYYETVQNLESIEGDAARANTETFFNRFAPFYHCLVLYAAIFLMACLSWVLWPGTLNRTAFWTMLLVATVHTISLGARMYIQGRPPVTNLYSSAIYIGWTGVLTCLFVEFFYRNSLALAAGSILGFLSLIVAHFLSLSGDTMEMMQAVLDTNFWLATHVTMVTFGYTASFLAGFLGIAYILLGVFTPKLAGHGATNLSKAIYGVACFATFLSFVGTVLGGIWADQSWGRFWGWDPKENGALLVVIWNALILHARWSGMVKQRGVAQLAVLGNVVTAWSWFGTNLLGVGLHSYGFMSGAMYWLLVFAATQLVIVAIALVPMRQWTSFRPTHAPRPRIDPLPPSSGRPLPGMLS